MKKNVGIFIVCAIIVIILDQVTKAVISQKLLLHEVSTIIPGFFNLVHVMNPGAAFGFLAEMPDTFRGVFFIGISLLALALILYFLAKSEKEPLIIIFSLALIFGGAVGNLIDRFRFGAVTDFLDFYVGNWHWPAFNVADSAITLGAFLMLWQIIFRREIRKKS